MLPPEISIRQTGGGSRDNRGRPPPFHSATTSQSRYILNVLAIRNTRYKGVPNFNQAQVSRQLCVSGLRSCTRGGFTAQINQDLRKATPWSFFSSFIGTSIASAQTVGIASGGGWKRDCQRLRRNSTRRHVATMYMLSGSTLPLAIAAVVGGTAAFVYWDPRRISRKPEIIMQKTDFNEAVLSRLNQTAPGVPPTPGYCDCIYIVDCLTMWNVLQRGLFNNVECITAWIVFTAWNVLQRGRAPGDDLGATHGSQKCMWTQ